MMRFKNKRTEPSCRHPEHSKPSGLRGEDAERPSTHSFTNEGAKRVEGSRVFFEGKHPRSKAIRAAAEEILRFAQNDEGGHRGRLGAALLALALAFGLCAAAWAEGAGSAAGAAAARANSTGGSNVEVLLKTAQPTGAEDDPVAGGSQLEVLLTSAASRDVTVTFLLEKPDAGMDARVYHTESIGVGVPVPKPPDPVWPKAPGDEDDYAFDVWCALDGSPYDFASPVRADTTLYASWVKKTPEQKTASVTFKGCGGTMASPDGASVGEFTAEGVLVGAHYPFPADPERTGYVFQGWFDAETGGSEVDAGATVGEAGAILYAQWRPVTYRVCYHENFGASPLAWTDPAVVTYDVTDGAAAVRFADWKTVRDRGGFRKPDGKDLDGWSTAKDGSGGLCRIGDAIANLTAVDGKVVDLYAVWKKDGTVEDGPFDVTFNFNDGTGATYVAKDVPKYGYVPEEDSVKDPKRTGYRFVGWCRDAGLASPWSFADQVTGDTELWAKWDLRLDVTLPVEVGFAVDADSREVTTPEADLYAIKSRTVAPVQVEEVAVISRDDELDEFFDLGEGAAGWQSALQDTALWVWKTGEGGVSSWTTDFAKEPDGKDGLSFELPLANAAGERGEYTRVNPDGTLGETITGWRNAVSLEGNESFRLERFEYGSAAFDEGWQGGDPSVRLPLKLGMGISDLLEVETYLDGPKPLAHLVVTVSAKG